MGQLQFYDILSPNSNHDITDVDLVHSKKKKKKKKKKFNIFENLIFPVLKISKRACTR